MRSFLLLLVGVLSWVVCLQCGLAFQHSTSTISNKLLWRHINKSAERKVQPTDDAARVSLMALEASMDRAGGKKRPLSSDKTWVPKYVDWKCNEIMPPDDKLRDGYEADDELRDGYEADDELEERTSCNPFGHEDWTVEWDNKKGRITHVTYPIRHLDWVGRKPKSSKCSYAQYIAPNSHRGHICPNRLCGIPNKDTKKRESWYQWYNIFPQSKSINVPPSVWTRLETAIGRIADIDVLSCHATVDFKYNNPLRPQYPDTIHYAIRCPSAFVVFWKYFLGEDVSAAWDTGHEKGHSYILFVFNNPFPSNNYSEHQLLLSELAGALDEKRAEAVFHYLLKEYPDLSKLFEDRDTSK